MRRLRDEGRRGRLHCRVPPGNCGLFVTAHLAGAVRGRGMASALAVGRGQLVRSGARAGRLLGRPGTVAVTGNAASAGGPCGRGEPGVFRDAGGARSLARDPGVVSRAGPRRWLIEQPSSNVTARGSASWIGVLQRQRFLPAARPGRVTPGGGRRAGRPSPRLVGQDSPGEGAPGTAVRTGERDRLRAGAPRPSERRQRRPGRRCRRSRRTAGGRHPAHRSAVRRPVSRRTAVPPRRRRDPPAAIRRAARLSALRHAASGRSVSRRPFGGAHATIHG